MGIDGCATAVHGKLALAVFSGMNSTTLTGALGVMLRYLTKKSANSPSL